MKKRLAIAWDRVTEKQDQCVREIGKMKKEERRRKEQRYNKRKQYNTTEDTEEID